MKNYSIVFDNVYTKDRFVNYCKANYIYCETSGYYDRGYYVAVLCTPETAKELDGFIDSILADDLEVV